MNFIFYFGILLLISYITLIFISPFKSIFFAIVIKPILDMSFSIYIIENINLSRIISILFALQMFFIILLNLKIIRRFSGNWFVFIWFLITILSYFWLGYKDIYSSLELLFRYSNFILPFIAIPFIIKKNESGFFLILIIASLMPIILTILQISGFHFGFYEKTIGGFLRPKGFFHDSFTNRLYFIYGLCGASYFILVNCKIYKKIFAIILFVLAGLCMYKLYSKSGYLIILLYLFLLLFKTTYKLKLLIIFSLLVFFVFNSTKIYTHISTTYQKEISYIMGKEKFEKIFKGRIQGWKENINEWKKFNLLKKIFGSSEIASGMHNDFLRILYCNGIIGLLFYITFLVYLIIKLIPNAFLTKNILYSLSSVLLGSFFLDSIGLVPTLYPAYNWMVWGIISYTINKKLFN